MLSLGLTCTLLASLFGGSTALNWSAPVLTTNSTLVELGHSFTATCEMPGFEAPNETYYLRILWKHERIVKYTFPEALLGDNSRKPTILNYVKPPITVRLLAYNLTSVQVEVTPLTVGDFNIECENEVYYSRSVYLKVVKSLLTPVFTLNTTLLTVNTPFTASCVIGDLERTQSHNTTVSFYSKQDGRLATFQNVTGASYLFIEKHDSVVVHGGSHASLPRFEVHLLESQAVQGSEYWCQLEVPSLGSYTSKHWIQEPVATFTSAKVDATSRLGICSLGNFNPSGREYSVQFFTDIGIKLENRMASYTVKPNHTLEFLAEKVYSWKAFLPGKETSFPKFTILATGGPAFHGTWWCLWGLGAEGSADYREIKSNAENLVY